MPEDCEISIREFFILRRFRRQGLGREAVRRFFEMNPGKYIVAQLATNEPARNFWHSVYVSLGIKYAERSEIESGVRLVIQGPASSLLGLFSCRKAETVL